MAGTTGDVIQIGVQMLRGTVTMRNVFYYRLLDNPTAGYLTGLDTEFRSQVLTPYAATQLTNYAFNSIQYLNIFSGDVLENNAPTPANGTRTITAGLSSTFMAGMILLTRQNNRVRHGRKFIFAPQETDYEDNVLTGTYLTTLQTLAGALDNNLFPGGVDEFQPVIVGRVPYITPQGRNAYRLPVSQAEMGDKWSPIGVPRAINRSTTMNSRKFWKGE